MPRAHIKTVVLTLVAVVVVVVVVVVVAAAVTVVVEVLWSNLQQCDYLLHKLLQGCYTQSKLRRRILPLKQTSISGEKDRLNKSLRLIYVHTESKTKNS